MVTILRNYAGIYIYLKNLKKKDIENESANVKNRKQKKSVFEKIPANYGAFRQHVRHAHLQSLIFNETNGAVIEMKNPEHFGWKFYETHYITIVTDNPIVLDTVISFSLCN